MSNSDKFTKYEEKAAPVAPPPPVMKLVARSRCRYTGNGEVRTAEKGDEVLNPLPQDLADLKAHNCVVEVESAQLDALRALLKSDNKELIAAFMAG